MKKSYGDIKREKNPQAYERARLLVDVTTSLKLALEDRGWNQKDLAARLGTSPSIVSRQLNAKENLTLEKLADLAFALNKRLEFKLRDLQTHGSRSSHLTLVPYNARENEAPLRLIASEQAAPTKHETAA